MTTPTPKVSQERGQTCHGVRDNLREPVLGLVLGPYRGDLAPKCGPKGPRLRRGHFEPPDPHGMDSKTGPKISPRKYQVQKRKTWSITPRTYGILCCLRDVPQ